MTPKAMLMPGGRARTAGAAAAVPSPAPVERPPFPADEPLAELPPLPVHEAPAGHPPLSADVPTLRPLAAAQVSTIRPAQPPAATPLAAGEVLTAGLPPPMATPATASIDVTRTASPPAHSWLVGRRIGNFVVERELGRGGFGAVYLARHVDADLALHQVIKILHSELRHRPDVNLSREGGSGQFARNAPEQAE